MRALSPNQKKEVRLNLIVSAALFLIYTVIYVIGRKSIPFFYYFETAGTLLLIAVFLHRFRPMYYLGIVAFAGIAQCGGVMFQLYVVIPIYDLLLHLASGVLLVFMGHYFLDLISRRHTERCIPPTVTLWFSWLFAVASAGVWEIYEFSADQFFGLDCQLRSLGEGGLIDTMTDIIMGTGGAVIGVIALALILRHESKRQK